MNGKKSTYARRFAWANRGLTPAQFLARVLDLNENDQVKKKITHEYKVLRRQAGMNAD
jgi:hypothetical protein